MNAENTREHKSEVKHTIRKRENKSAARALFLTLRTIRRPKMLQLSPDFATTQAKKIFEKFFEMSKRAKCRPRRLISSSSSDEEHAPLDEVQGEIFHYSEFSNILEKSAASRAVVLPHGLLYTCFCCSRSLRESCDFASKSPLLQSLCSAKFKF
jgi:hypothetical protein